MDGPLRRRRAIVLVAAVGLIVLLTMACDDTYAVESYLNDFLGGRSTTDQTQDDTGHTGDDEVDGILEASEHVTEIKEADEEWSDGMDYHIAGRPAEAAPYIDRAIAKRPDDLRYRSSRARVALAQDDAGLAREQWNEQDRIAEMNGWTDDAWYWEGVLNDAFIVARELTNDTSDPLTFTRAQDQRAATIYNRTADALEVLADMDEAAGDDWAAADRRDLAWEYREKAKRHGG